MKAIKKIRILHAIRQGKVGGGETHVLDLVHQLNPEKFESVILAFTPGPMVDQLKSEGFRVYVIPTERPFNWKVWPAVTELLTDENIDLVHAHGTRANSNTFYSAKKLNIPLVYTVHGWSFHPDQSMPIKFIRSQSERLLVSKADHTICVSQSNLTDGKKRFPISRGSVIVNGINQNKFNPDQSFPDFRKEINIEGNAVLVGYIARITAQKDPFNFLRSIALTPELIRYVIIGDGELKPEMLRLAAELGLMERIVFLDFRSDIPSILNAIDIFCLPSLWEGLPIALLEAMAMRKAIVATAIDGTKDLVRQMENGILIPVSEPEKLANAIITLASDRNLRERLGEQAYKTIKENFGVEEMTLKIEKVYNEFLRLKS